MNDEKNIVESDLDDAILTKFSNLLNKYHNPANLNPHAEAAPVTQSMSAADQPDHLPAATVVTSIPVLTEAVILDAIEPAAQSESIKPVRTILDAALKDANIAMTYADRCALADALEIRWAEHFKST